MSSRKYAPDVYTCIEELYKNDYKPAQIRALFKMELGLDIHLHTIMYHSTRKKYMQKYCRNPDVRTELTRKLGVKNNLTTRILEVFDTDELTVEEIREKLNEKFGTKFTKRFDKTIDKEIKSLEKRFESGNSPILRVKPRKYILNTESPYWKMCDGFAER